VTTIKVNLNAKIDILSEQMKHLGSDVASQIKLLSNEIHTNAAELRAELKGYEAQFLGRVVFSVSGLRICYILPSNNMKVIGMAVVGVGGTVAAALLGYLGAQTRAMETLAVEKK
jgi:hypothetical protein